MHDLTYFLNSMNYEKRSHFSHFIDIYITDTTCLIALYMNLLKLIFVYPDPPWWFLSLMIWRIFWIGPLYCMVFDASEIWCAAHVFFACRFKVITLHSGFLEIWGLHNELKSFLKVHYQNKFRIIAVLQTWLYKKLIKKETI